jgi:hypothetical protein
MIITVYESDYSNYHLEYHPIEHNKIQSARLLSKETIESVMRNLKLLRKPKTKKKNENVLLKKGVSGIIPKNLFYMSIDEINTCLIFFEKAKKRELLFTKDKNSLDSKEYNIPNVVYLYYNQSLFIYAYKEWKGSNTKLYLLPLPNIDEKGSVCMGNVERTKINNLSSIIDQTIDTFWNSYFREWRIDNHSSVESMWRKNKFTFLESFYIDTLKNVAKKTLPTEWTNS